MQYTSDLFIISLLYIIFLFFQAFFLVSEGKWRDWERPGLKGSFEPEVNSAVNLRRGFVYVDVCLKKHSSQLQEILAC